MREGRRENDHSGEPATVRSGLRSRLFLAALIAAALGGAAGLGADEQREDQKASGPRDIGLAERARRRLAQIDITVIGPPESVASLSAENFTIRVNLHKLREFQIDRLCDAAEPAAPEGEARPDRAAVVGAASPATYLFYFDQPLLTMEGRQRSIDVASELIERLVQGGVRAMIVSTARETVIVQGLTTDAALLTRKLEELGEDRRQWDMYAHNEDQRVGDVLRTLNDTDNLSGAVSQASLYQREEYWYMTRSLRRLSITLGQLVDLDPPKALVYFADMVRSNPGEHYLSFFGAYRAAMPQLGAMTADALMGGLAFDNVVNAASAQGIRVYTVEARGLTADMDSALPNPSAMTRTYTVASPSRVRLGDTHRALENLAAETGGRSFLHGVRASKIAERIVADSSCIYLASFDPSSFPEDTPLRVDVRVDRDDVELRVRGRLVLQSESVRKTSELLRAFSSPDSIADPFAVDAGLVPTGFSNGTYTALLQIRVPGSPLHGAVWDVGASLVADSKVREKTSGRVSPSGREVPVILEQEWNFRPGAYEVVAVAHETKSGLVASTRVLVDWPSLGHGGDAAVGPIAVLHPAAGAFVRGGRTRASGSVLIPDASPLSTTEPAAFVGLVCRGKRSDPVRVARRLVGETSHGFPDLEIVHDDQPCAQIRDVVPSNTLRPGYYRYEVRVLSGEQTLANGRRDFVALAPEIGLSRDSE